MEKVPIVKIKIKQLLIKPKIMNNINNDYDSLYPALFIATKERMNALSRRHEDIKIRRKLHKINRQKR